MSTRPEPREVAAAFAGLLRSPRFSAVLATTGVAIAALSYPLIRLTGWAGYLAALGGLVALMVVVLIWPDFAFKYLMSVALIAGIINWTMIMITERKFRHRIGPDGTNALAFKLPGGRVTTWIVLAFMALVIVLMARSSAYRTAIYVGPVWLAVLLITYEVKRRRPGAPTPIEAPRHEHTGPLA